jgi:hypothetical protein
MLLGYLCSTILSTPYYITIRSSIRNHASTNETLRCIHPSAYAASLMSSSRGALNGTGAPCKIGTARTASLLLVKSDGIIAFSAIPSV